MTWTDIRRAYPNRWLLVEAMEAHTMANRTRHLDQLSVVELCLDGPEAFKRYRILHAEYPNREFYYLHTTRELITVTGHQWLGVRLSDATRSTR